MATEAQRKAHDLLREQTRQQIIDRCAANRTERVYFPSNSGSASEPRDVLREMAEGRHPRDILQDIAERRPPPPSLAAPAPAPAPAPAAAPLSEEEPKTPTKKKANSIPKKIRTLVWNEYIGKEIGESKCICCNKTMIDKAEFHCGHILAQANGGTNTVSNLRPICSGCNTSMGTRDMNEFCREFFGRGLIETSMSTPRSVGEPTGVPLAAGAGAGAGACASVIADYKPKTRAELLTLCKEEGITGYSNKKKEDLLALLIAQLEKR